MYRGNGYIERHYPTMELEQITALPVKELADRDAILFLWTTLPMIQEALQVIKACLPPCLHGKNAFHRETN